MTFLNDETQQSAACKEVILKTLAMASIGVVVAFASIFMTMKNETTFVEVIVGTAVLVAVAITISLLLKWRVFIRNYKSYKIELAESSIIISNRRMNKNLPFSEITEIRKSQKGDITLCSGKIKKFTVPRFIKDLPLLEAELQKIKEIQPLSTKQEYIQYIPLIILFGMKFARLSENPIIFLIAGSLFFGSVIFSLVKLFFSGTRIISLILSIAIYGYIGVMIGKEMYKVIIILAQ
ncbi:MAG: hypothetical protein JXR63_09500 [Spirochaetales bacterium]|nr:hypothetical protein [Spirochaetales bacterium]